MVLFLSKSSSESELARILQSKPYTKNPYVGNASLKEIISSTHIDRSSRNLIDAYKENPHKEVFPLIFVRV